MRELRGGPKRAQSGVARIILSYLRPTRLGARCWREAFLTHARKLCGAGNRAEISSAEGP